MSIAVPEEKFASHPTPTMTPLGSENPYESSSLFEDAVEFNSLDSLDDDAENITSLPHINLQATPEAV